MNRKFESIDTGTPAQHEKTFWIGQFYTALAGILIGSFVLLANIAYLANGTDRTLIILTVAVVYLICIGFTLLRHRIVASRHCVYFFAGANIVFSLSLGALYALSSHNSFLITIGFFLSMLHLGIGYPRRAAVPCGLACLLIFSLLFLLPASKTQHWEMLVMLFVLVDAYMLVLFGASVRDRKDRQWIRLHHHLEQMATTDALTGCLNQRGFNNALTREIARGDRSGHCLSLLLIDVDDFKIINDCYGHAAGDNTLSGIGEAILDTVRETDCAGRPGGDELSLLAPDTDAETARQLAERLQAAVAALQLPMHVTLSIGIHTAAPNTAQLDTMFKRADQALYHAKRTGRGRICVFDPQMEADAEELQPRPQVEEGRLEYG